jgi:virginiamycin B lyase
VLRFGKRQVLIISLFIIGLIGTAATLGFQWGVNGDSGQRALASSLSDLHVLSRIGTPKNTYGMGLGFNSIWTPSDGKLIRIDAASGEIQAEIPIGQGPYHGVAVATDFVWVLNRGDHTLSQIDPVSNRAVRTIPVSTDANDEGTIGVGEDAVWVVTSDADSLHKNLSRINPESGQIIAKTPIPADSGSVIVSFGGVWITNPKANTVTRIDPSSGQIVASIRVNRNPRSIDAGLGSIWVLCQKDGTVSRIDPTTNRVVAAIEAVPPGSSADLSVGQGSVWLASTGNTLSRIDPETNAVAQRYQDSLGANAIQAGLGFVWISEHAGQIWKISAQRD